ALMSQKSLSVETKSSLNYLCASCGGLPPFKKMRLVDDDSFFGMVALFYNLHNSFYLKIVTCGAADAVDIVSGMLKKQNDQRNRVSHWFAKLSELGNRRIRSNSRCEALR